jgi:hypothetical protein
VVVPLITQVLLVAELLVATGLRLATHQTKASVLEQPTLVLVDQAVVLVVREL